MKVSSVIQFIYAEVRRSIPGLEWCVCSASPVLNQKLRPQENGTGVPPDLLWVPPLFTSGGSDCPVSM